MYQTRYPDKLNVKMLEIKVKDKTLFGSDKLVGAVMLDLLTIACGPVRHIMPLRDGASTRGRFIVDVTMEQESQVVVNIQNVDYFVEGLSALDISSSDLSLKYASSTESDMMSKAVSTPAGSSHLPYLDRVRVLARVCLCVSACLSVCLFRPAAVHPLLMVSPPPAAVPQIHRRQDERQQPSLLGHAQRPFWC